MARKSAAALKVVEPPVDVAAVESWDGVDERMLEIGRQDLEIIQLETQLEKLILDASAVLAPRIKEAKARREADAGAVIGFAKEHRAEVDGKTWKGAFGKLTWPNESSAVVLELTEETVIKKLKGRPELAHCIRTIEQIDKEALKALPAAEGKKLGFSIDRRNVAGEETDPPKLSIDRKKVEKHDAKSSHHREEPKSAKRR